MKTRAFLLAGVTTLLLATGTAHATTRLPEEMLGKWCKNETQKYSDMYTRTTSGFCKHKDDLLVMREDVYKEEGGTCAYDWVQRVGEAYMVRLDCLYPPGTYNEYGDKLNEGGEVTEGEVKSAPSLELYLIDNRLYIIAVPEV